MHLYFSGIGGTGIGPLALIAKQAGYTISGSDKQASLYIDYLKKHNVRDIHIGQTTAGIAEVHARKPIDWFVYSSALPRENPNHPELLFCQQNNIKATKRDELLNEILKAKNLKLIAVAGTHGKTTTTAMAIWLFKQLGLSISYSVGGKISFGEMGHYDPRSQYFIYECDEFDRNFLAFEPYVSLISGVGWDHHEVFSTKEEYNEAFTQFISQSRRTIIWQRDAEYLGLEQTESIIVLDPVETGVDKLLLPGRYNREDARLVVQAVAEITKDPLEKLNGLVNEFPGVARRFEKLVDNLYSDYAHTPEKITGCMSVAKELAAKSKQKIIVIYEPLTNRRIHYTKEQHKDVFDGADQIYWVPSYLAREDPAQAILRPAELISYLSPQLQAVAKPMEFNGKLKAAIQKHLDQGDLVVAMSGGGGGSLDEWLRKMFIRPLTH